MAFENLTPPPSSIKDWGWGWIKWLSLLYTWIQNNVNKDFFFELAKGNVAGHSDHHIIAFNSANTISTEYDVWPTASANKVWRTAAVQLEAISTSANDDGTPTTSTGAQTIMVYGLDANFLPIEESITLAGLAASTSTTQSFLRVNQVVVTSAGGYASVSTTGSNLGVITVRGTGAGTTECEIPIGVGISQNSHYTIPAGYTGYINRMMLNVEATKSSYFKLYARSAANDVVQPYSPRILVHEWPGVSGLFEESTDVHYPVSEMSDVWLTAAPGANNTIIHTNYDIILVKN